TGTRWTYTASGPVTKLAARLARLGPGEIVSVGAGARGRLGGGVPLRGVGAIPPRPLAPPGPGLPPPPPSPPAPAPPPAAREGGSARGANGRTAGRQPRPIDQKSAPKRSQGSRHSSVRSGSGVKNRFTA